MAISLTNVWKTYGEGPTAVHALAGVDAEIPAGQFAVILGPSGSGKTTMLNLIGGIDDVTSGDLLVEDVKLTGLAPDDRTAFRRSTVDRDDLSVDPFGISSEQERGQACDVVGIAGSTQRVHRFGCLLWLLAGVGDPFDQRTRWDLHAFIPEGVAARSSEGSRSAPRQE